MNVNTVTAQDSCKRHRLPDWTGLDSTRLDSARLVNALQMSARQRTLCAEFPLHNHNNNDINVITS